MQGTGDPARADPALEGRRLTKTFGGRVVVDQVDLAARSGMIHGLLGPNGAGKSTVLRILLGLVRPDSGDVLAQARRLDPATPRGALGVAGFAEAPGFYPYLTARRNLELLAAWTGRAAQSRVDDLLNQVGLADRAPTKVRHFSTGMRQRLGLAAALIDEPEVLILDEPTTGLDPAGIRDLRDLLSKVADTGRSVLLSSHNLDDVDALCHEVTVLRAGAVIYNGTTAQLRERTAQRRYLLRTTDDDHAAALALRAGGIDIAASTDGLTVAGDLAAVDRLVLALASDAIAVRHLQREDLPLESLFFQLTEDDTSAADQVSS